MLLHMISHSTATTVVDPPVLVVENEAIIRLDLVTELERQGFTVFEAADGTGAVQLLHRHRNIGAVVVDVGLHFGMTGYEIARAARQSRPGCTIIIASADAVKMPDDFDEHVLLQDKPYDPEKIAFMLKMGSCPR